MQNSKVGDTAKKRSCLRWSLYVPFPVEKQSFCWLSYEPENKAARNLYRTFGFVETGEKDGEELIAVLKLSANVTEGTLSTKTLFSNDKCRTVK